MFSTDSEIALTILISTVLLLFFGALITYFLFKYQRKRHEHQKEVINLKESFGQTLLRSKLEIQEQTLDHISKELHANISQLASLINIHLSEFLEKTDDENRENVLETKSLTKQLMSELRGIGAALNTDYIMKIGFSSALENELNRISKAMKYPATLTKTGHPFRLSAETEIILFRLCQEVLSNSVKYANANKITVVIDYTNNSIHLEIIDNGSGFDIDEAFEQCSEKESTGLVNIRKRAKIIGADIHIESQRELGTKVAIDIPK